MNILCLKTNPNYDISLNLTTELFTFWVLRVYMLHISPTLTLMQVTLLCFKSEVSDKWPVWLFKLEDVLINHTDS